ncbi:hypothetical protein PSECIP111854_00605 [Pseudoalteromonas sp. CIP111854]|uniref:YbbD head domain-containing protein n=1 Tax=Pseudoalteromonas holothuriae TaxID=2963714 RepID=A0A9W4QSC3_9GAMM|nr:hypothetical protein [Pseudoalteromonas sp. CIP111854]CAH9050794.1 hypothetical protein PSECIP111854_00605 [Pseudoalteromonas sp. CIP111854]
MLQKNGLFERGWLPDVLPKSTTNIVAVNDLDNNTSAGNFTLEKTHLNKFLAHVEQTNLMNQYRFSDSDNTWLFIVNETGLVRYQLDKL